jgi:hypothetical protein
MNKHTKHAAGKQRWRRKRGPLGFSIPEAGAMIGLGRDASYDAAKKGQIPTIEMGQQKIVPRIPWLRKLGVEGDIEI